MPPTGWSKNFKRRFTKKDCETATEISQRLFVLNRLRQNRMQSEAPRPNRDFPPPPRQRDTHHPPRLLSYQTDRTHRRRSKQKVRQTACTQEFRKQSSLTGHPRCRKTRIPARHSHTRDHPTIEEIQGTFLAAVDSEKSTPGNQRAETRQTTGLFWGRDFFAGQRFLLLPFLSPALKLMPQVTESARSWPPVTALFVQTRPPNPSSRKSSLSLHQALKR